MVDALNTPGITTTTQSKPAYAPVGRQYSTTEGLYFTAGGKAFYAKQYGSGRAAEDAANQYLASLGETGVPVGTSVGAKPADMSQEYRYHDPGDIHYFMPGGEGYRAGKAPEVSQKTVQAIAERPASQITPGSEVAAIKGQVGQVAPATQRQPPTARPVDELTQIQKGGFSTEGLTASFNPESGELTTFTHPLPTKATTIPGYRPIDLNYLVSTPEAKDSTESYRSSMPSFQVQTGSVIERFTYYPGIQLRDVLGGVTNVQPGKLYARDIFGFTRELPQREAPLITEQQAQARRFAEQVGLFGASSGEAIATTSALRGAKLIQPRDVEAVTNVLKTTGSRLKSGFGGLFPEEVATPTSMGFGKYEGESGFSGKIMGYEKAVPRTPEIVERIPQSNVGLMTYEKAIPRIPENIAPIRPIEAAGGAGRAKTLSDIPEVSKLMSYEKAVPRVPETVETIPKETVGLMTYEKAIPRAPEIFEPIKPIETAGGSGRAKSLLNIPEAPKPIVGDVIDLSKMEPLKSPKYIQELTPKEPLTDIEKSVEIINLPEEKPFKAPSREPFKEIKTKGGQILIQKLKLEEPKELEVIDLTKMEPLKPSAYESATKVKYLPLYSQQLRSISRPSGRQLGSFEQITKQITRIIPSETQRPAFGRKVLSNMLPKSMSKTSTSTVSLPKSETIPQTSSIAIPITRTLTEASAKEITKQVSSELPIERQIVVQREDFLPASQDVQKQIPISFVSPQYPEDIGKKKRKSTRPVKSYQVRNPFPTLEQEVSGATTKQLKSMAPKFEIPEIPDFNAMFGGKQRKSKKSRRTKR